MNIKCEGKKIKGVGLKSWRVWHGIQGGGRQEEEGQKKKILVSN